ncbi:MAG: hypothetical protein RLZZ324_1130 [Candidatus Parcubacteria bacterium]|jgi:ABC-2 type transport system ATP-binding protein
MVSTGKKEAVLEFRGVTKRFGDTVAVNALRLSVHEGEIYGLIGPNGAGKTTTVKMAAGLYRPTTGTVRVAGIDMSGEPTKAKAHLGYVPDDPSAYDRLSGREFLQFIGEIRGMDRDARDARIEALLDEYHIRGLADGAFGAYSRGSKQKISFIAALLHQPAVLLVDEPMVGLDPESARITMRLLTEYAHGGGAVLLSTHSLGVAEEICHRFGLLKEGKLMMEGTAADLAARAGTGGSLEKSYLTLTGAAS